MRTGSQHISLDKTFVLLWGYVRPMDDIREDPSRAPLLVFFPVKPRPHYMVSGRVYGFDLLVKVWFVFIVLALDVLGLLR